MEKANGLCTRNVIVVVLASTAHALIASIVRDWASAARMALKAWPVAVGIHKLI